MGRVSVNCGEARVARTRERKKERKASVSIPEVKVGVGFARVHPERNRVFTLQKVSRETGYRAGVDGTAQTLNKAPQMNTREFKGKCGGCGDL